MVAVLHGAADLIDVGEIDLRIHATGEQIQAQRHQAYVSGSFAVTKQTALDPIRSGLVPQLRCGNRGTAVIVGMQAHDDRVAASQVAAHPLDRVGVNIRCGHLHGRRQVDDQRPVRCRLDNSRHRITDVLGVFQFGSGVGLR